MKELFKLIKQEFKPWGENLKFKTKKTIVTETISLLPKENSKKKQIKIDFIYLKANHALDVRISYLIKKENDLIFEDIHAFSKSNEDKSLAMLSLEAKQEILANISYLVEDNQLKSNIDPLEQAKIFIRIIKENYQSIINYKIDH